MMLTSLQGERWDTLCIRAYGAVSQALLMQLRQANPHAARLSDGFVLPAGLAIDVPELKGVSTRVVEIAPWQR